jgi:hypothetical protein
VIKEPISQEFDKGQPKVAEIGGEDNKFPHEYAVSGWFRFKSFPK